MLHTLKKESEFKKVAKNGRPFFASEMAIKILANNLEYNRYGIVVNTKVDKRAVVRNKIQRRIRDIIRLNSENFNNGFDVMILTKEEIKKLDYKEIKEKIEKLFKKSGILK
jgi:ribonuclease P protein component